MCVCVCESACAHGRVHVALLIQHSKRMRHTVLSIVASLAPPYFRHYLINGTIFERKKVTEKMTYVFWFSVQLLFGTFLILRRIQGDIAINVETSSCKVPVIILVGILRNLKFSRQFFEKKGSNIKVTFSADARKNTRDVANSRFSKFCKRP